VDEYIKSPILKEDPDVCEDNKKLVFPLFLVKAMRHDNNVNLEQYYVGIAIDPKIIAEREERNAKIMALLYNKGYYSKEMIALFTRTLKEDIYYR